MSKKEFYEKYIKDNRTEDEKMMDIIHENARKNKYDKLYQENRNQRNKSIKTRNKGISIPQLIVILLLILILVAIWV